MREDEVVQQPLVVAHAARSMVVDTNSEQVAVEVDVIGAGQAAICLEGNAYRSARPAESMQPLDGRAVHNLDATTNPEGGPKEGKEVSLPLDFAFLCLNITTNTDDMSLVLRAQCLIPGATPARAQQEASRPPPETKRKRGDKELGQDTVVDRQQTGDGGGEVEEK